MNTILNVGVVGFGMSAQVFHLPFIKALPNYNLAAIVQRTGNTAKEKYPEATIYRHFDELCADENIDLIVITTPNETHFPFAKKALEHNKHVVVEKPFANTTKEALALVEIAQQSTPTLSVYQNRRYVADFNTIVALLKNQTLGDVHEYECHFDRYRLEAKPNAWREANIPGSGILYDLGSHLIDQALCLFGLPQSITADIKMQRPHSTVDDYFDIRLDFGYTKAILKSSMMVLEMGPRYMLHGTKGSYIKYGDDPQEAALKNGDSPLSKNWGMEPDDMAGILHTIENGVESRLKLPSLLGNFGDYYNNLYNNIVHKSPILEKPEHGYNTIVLIEQAFESSKQKRTLTCNNLIDAPYPFF